MLRRVTFWLFLVSGLPLSAGPRNVTLEVDANPAAQQSPAAEWQVYRYRMAGRVRLLLFWIGREDVGGGAIAFSRAAAVGSQLRTETIEVLFGSDPSRVPGKINRWGYGREEAVWQVDSVAHPARLASTAFEGFMRHSSEESLSQVRSNSSSEKEKSLFWFDAIRSTVTPSEAFATIHFFSQEKEFDYTNPAPVSCAYQRRLLEGPPDRRRSLRREGPKDVAPYGFLTALRELMRQVAQNSAPGGVGRASDRLSLPYVYNAKSYRLAVQGLKVHKEYRFNPGGRTGKNLEFPNVIESDFEITNLQSKDKHGFTIWYPASGHLKEVPLRIVDKPRWWLRVELTLDPESIGRADSGRTQGVMPDCKQGPG